MKLTVDTMDAADYVAQTKKANKFKAVKHDEDGHTFASGAELRRYRELKLMVQAGEIVDLMIHSPVFGIVVNGHKVSRYTPDFSYHRAETDEWVIEDVKGGRATKTRDYVLRKKLVKALYGVEIVEIAA